MKHHAKAICVRVLCIVKEIPHEVLKAQQILLLTKITRSHTHLEFLLKLL
jgi:hypothetical protein